MKALTESGDLETDIFFQEYTSKESIQKYSRATAGTGISYLLEHDYKEVYLEALKHLPEASRQNGINMLEFGCGAGMNLIWLAAMLESQGLPVAKAIGTDFSPVLIEAAKNESRDFLSDRDQAKVEFHVANNDSLISDMAESLAEDRSAISAAFDFIIGVNTIRYSHRSGKQKDCARDIYDMLVPGGISVVIDMNQRFPLFRSAVKARLRGEDPNEADCYLPTLEEYTEPFKEVGFEVLNSENFCWVPHSAGPIMCKALQLATPVLNLFARSRAMRSLVVVRKPISY
jgi:SAM-dependent methyltransferase